MSVMASMTIVRTGGVPCGCGCGELVYDRRGNTKYVNERHRQRAYRTRLKQRLRESGLPEHLNLKVAEGARRRHGDARKRRTPDLRVSYRKAVDALAAEFERLSTGAPLGSAHCERAERTLAPLLTDKQRAALKELGS